MQVSAIPASTPWLRVFAGRSDVYPGQPVQNEGHVGHSYRDQPVDNRWGPRPDDRFANGRPHARDEEEYTRCETFSHNS